jgi:RNA polymerase sigma-70 factor (ECF subfamily)
MKPFTENYFQSTKLTLNKRININNIPSGMNNLENDEHLSNSPPPIMQNLNKESDNLSNWYVIHMPELLFLAYHIVENEADAEDIVSSFFEKIVRSTNENSHSLILGSDFDLLGYFRISIKNACLDHLRRKKIKIKVLSHLEDTLQYWKQPEVNDLMEDERIEFLLLNLPLRERQIFKMHLDGLKNHEISASLGLSEITIRNTLHNARKRIRKIWTNYMH